jgi:GMP synthase-like glutamine amidotransferase
LGRKIPNCYRSGDAMKALFIQHDHVSPTGPVAERLRHHGFEIEERVVVAAENYHTPNVHFEFPDWRDYDLLIPMGSPWGVWDDSCVGNWVLPELEWVRGAIEADKPVFGICFGGQLIARAMGGSVAPGPKGEIGWTWISTEQPELVGPGPWFQFHYDRWTLPAGATEIARTPVASQAFTIGRSLALQFHPELDANALQGWLDWEGDKAVERDGQDPAVMLWQTKHEEAAARLRTFELVDAYLKFAGLI